MPDETNRLISLRAASKDDAAFLRAVYASTRAEELAQVPWADEQKKAFTDSQFAAQDAHYRAHYPTARFSVIMRGETPVGRLYVDRWTREIRVMDITVLPEHRGSGIGTQLLRELQEEARAEDKSLTIHVEKFNRARALYERLGFSVMEDKGVYLLMEWRG